MSSRFIENASHGGVTFKRDIIAAARSARSIDIAVSYLQMSGWFVLERELQRIHPKEIRILTTDQMNVTQPAVLRSALRLGIHVRCYRGSRVFHPKVYLLHGVRKMQNIAVLGSANISASGLKSGVEAGMRISEPRLFRQLARWFDALFGDAATERVDEDFVVEYERQWKLAAQARVPLRRIAEARRRPDELPTPEDEDVLDDVFSTIRLPVGTLGFDHAGNNVRNIKRLLDVLARYPQIGNKERSELHLLGFMHNGGLSPLGASAQRCRTARSVAKLWVSWLKRTPDPDLGRLNDRLTSFKRAASRFWHLKPEVRNYFLRELRNPQQRATLQAIELCCNGSAVVDSLSINDFKAITPFMLRDILGFSWLRQGVFQDGVC